MGGSCDPRATNNPSDPSLNDLIRARQQQLRNRDSKRLRGLQVDPKLEFSRLLNREIGRVSTAEDSVNKCGLALVLLRYEPRLPDAEFRPDYQSRPGIVRSMTARAEKETSNRLKQLTQERVV